MSTVSLATTMTSLIYPDALRPHLSYFAVSDEVDKKANAL
jgi:hypothetical protein